jgi:hypothetical protein
MQLEKFSSKLLAGFYHRTVRLFTTLEPPISSEQVLRPNHVRCLFRVFRETTERNRTHEQEDAASGMPEFATSIEAFCEQKAIGRQMVFSRKGLLHENFPDSSDEENSENLHVVHAIPFQQLLTFN